MKTPARFGRFEIRGEIGRGAMGIVFLARDPDLDREVALKVTIADETWLGDEAIHRFLREARSAAGLSHPGIVPVFEAGRAEGRYYYSMERIDGESLARRIERVGPLGERESASIVRALAGAVAYAHEAGVLHRDMKPANVLMASDGRVLVADFGLARPVAGRTDLTRTGDVLGTREYMAPEQAAGDVDALDGRADVYGLGAILHEILTGRTPGTDPDPMRGVSEELANIARRALATDRDLRTGSARELALQLERFLAGPGPGEDRRVARALRTPGVEAAHEARIELPVSVSEAWRLLADTEHLNRSIGLPPVAYGPVTVAGHGFYREARARLFGLLRLVWREYPFEWERERGYAVLREYQAGPLSRLLAGVEIEERPSGSLVRVHVQIAPRWRILRPFATFFARTMIRATVDYLREYAERRQAFPDDPLPRARTRGSADIDRLETLARRLEAATVDVDARARLLELVRRGTDEEVRSIRPRELADHWGIDREEVLRVFLEAMKIGLLEARWELLCPHCRVPKAHAGTLGDLPPAVPCDLCGADPTIELDANVELRFRIHPSIRKADSLIYCLGGPGRAPHIDRQVYLAPGARRELEIQIGEEPRRLRALRTNRILELSSEKGAPIPDQIALEIDGWPTPRLALPPGRVRVALVNRSPLARVVVLERVRWDDRALTALEAAAREDLRDLVGGRSGARPLAVGRLGIAIAVLDRHAGETELAAARRIVEDQARLHGGSLAGSAGRTLLCAFVYDVAALAFARQLLAAGDATRFALAVHADRAVSFTGPDGGVIYEGRAVRAALALARVARAGSIVLFEEFYAELACGHEPTAAERFEASLEGFPGTSTLVRLRGDSGPGDHGPVDPEDETLSH